MYYAFEKVIMQNVITYPPTALGWDLVVRLKEQITVCAIHLEMNHIPELVLTNGESYSGFDAIENYIQLCTRTPKPASENNSAIPKEHVSL